MKVCENTAPKPMVPEFQMPFGEPGKAPPDPEVEVWATLPVLVHRTVSPTEIVIVAGMIENWLPPSCNETR